jgi:hypothetical protein
MMTKPKIALTAAVILGAASAALAKDSGPPNIDIQNTCRESSGALISVTGNNKQDLDSCINDEQEARTTVTKAWANYPSLAKSKCINPKDYLPSYVEWLSCLEMTRDVIKMRQDKRLPDTTSGQSSGSRTGSKSKGECPVVQFGEDGSIKSVITNC